jgi:hypothetical protein
MRLDRRHPVEVLKGVVVQEALLDRRLLAYI